MNDGRHAGALATADRWLAGRRAFAVGVAALVVAASAQVTVPVPLSPVPMTLQPLAVIAVGGLLGAALGGSALLLYLCLGLLGLPVFAGGSGGLLHVLGPTGGYLLAFPAAASRTESLILWRRIAGGLPAGHQRSLAEPLLASIRTLYKRYTSGKATDPAFSPHESLEVLRLLGSLELLPVETKIELSDMLIELATRKKLEPIRRTILWAIGRLGARQPAYGPLNTVVPPAEAAAWIEKLLIQQPIDALTQFAVVNLARRTGDRFRDIDEPLRTRVLTWLAEQSADEHAQRLVREGGELDTEEQGRVFGEELPKGLRVR